MLASFSQLNHGSTILNGLTEDLCLNLVSRFHLLEVVSLGRCLNSVQASNHRHFTLYANFNEGAHSFD